MSLYSTPTKSGGADSQTPIPILSPFMPRNVVEYAEEVNAVSKYFVSFTFYYM